MNSLKGYKPLILNKGDLKHIEKFIELDGKDSGFVDNLTKLLNDKEFGGIVYGLKKDNKYKAVYVFEPEKGNSEGGIIKYTRCATLEDVPEEIINEFEKMITEELREAVNIDETWQKVIWNDLVIEQKSIRLGTINLFTTIVVILLCVMIGAIINHLFILSAVGVIAGIIMRNCSGKNGEKMSAAIT